MNMLSLLRERLPAMTPSERKIAQCILESPETAVDETLTHLAQRAGTSAGSVANFAVSMGLRGFSDLKIQLAKSLEHAQLPAFDGVNAADDPRGAMQKIIAAAQLSFDETLRSMGNELAQAAAILQNARRIEIYASGSSLPIGQDAHYRLMRLGLPASFQPDALLSSMSASQLTDGDAVIAISHKGRTTNTLAAADTARRRGAKLIALTSFPQSPLARLSDVRLISRSMEAANDREAVISRLTQLVILDSLCAYLAAQRGDEATQLLDNEIELLERYREDRIPSC